MKELINKVAKRGWCFLLLLALQTGVIVISPVGWSGTVHGATFYVDPVYGDDSNDGLSPSTARRTVNQNEILSLSNGNKILFNKSPIVAGSRESLQPGFAGEPIVTGDNCCQTDRIILGSEVISGWSQYVPDVWQAPLRTNPKHVGSNDTWYESVSLDSLKCLPGISLCIDDLGNSQWYWESGVLYTRDTDGNPDKTGKTIHAVVRNRGWSITAGDFNGDGFNDVVSVDQVYDGAAFNTGEVYVNYGKGVFLIPPDQILSDPDGNKQDQFGFSVASAGDVNNDGCDELIVAMGWGINKVYLYMGSQQGLSYLPDKTLLPPVGYPGYGFGHAISKRSGDINGDGFDDILIGSGSHPNYFCVYHGSPSGIESNPDAIVTYPGTEEGSQLNLSFVGDTNNSGFDGLAVSPRIVTPSSVCDVYVYQGSSAGVSKDPPHIITIDSGWIHSFGFNVTPSRAGDIDGDGFDDLLVGNEWAFGSDINEGKAYVHYGSSSGLSPFPDVTFANPQPAFNARFGVSVDGIDDFNHDGFRDIIVGSPYRNSIAAIYYGSSKGITAIPSLTLAEVGFFGSAVSHAGDIKGNGQNFIVVGEEIGGAYLYALKKTRGVIVNNYVEFVPIADTYKVTSDTAGCPEGFAGKLGFKARLENTSSIDLIQLTVKIVILTNGNLLHNADGGPDGEGGILTIPQTGHYLDGKLSPGEFVDVSIEICLKALEPFRFLGDLTGVPISKEEQ
ncbi:MAG: VCBS repeat-containing protein [Candidatus Scalindua sp.]|nr:VCBS repeat-containing protein [Candidatus Scalindua sp.]